MRTNAILAATFALCAPLLADQTSALAEKRIAFLGDSITQAGQYVGFATYYLEKLHPAQSFDVYNFGLGSETLSGLSEDGHAGGAFPRPCLFARLGRLLEKAKPEIVIACYGINDGIYQPLDEARFAAFRTGVSNFVVQCRAGGVQQVVLVTPPIYDAATKPGEFNYDTVMTAYAAWEASLKWPGVQVIDLHTAMRKARDARTEVFSKDHVHPGEEGHLLMAKTILAGLGVHAPDEPLATIKADPVYRLVEEQRQLRWDRWMKHVGYTREKTVAPQPLGDAEERSAAIQQKIDALRRAAPVKQ